MHFVLNEIAYFFISKMIRW